jgi:hypothetical protein
MLKFLSLLVSFLLVVQLKAFVPTSIGSARNQHVALLESKKNEDSNGGFFGSFVKDFKGMVDNMDDVIDDFLFKRMGAGEQWYGKRKYDPSGKFDEEYQGMGLSDHVRIEVSRARKEKFLAERERRRRES